MWGMPLAEIGMHVGAAAAVLVVSFMFFARGWIGGGDAKLAAATALWLGFDQLLNYLIFASLFGGVLTLAIMRFRADAAARLAGEPGMGEAAAPHGHRRALRHRARACGAADLPRYALDEIARHVSRRRPIASRTFDLQLQFRRARVPARTDAHSRAKSRATIG